MLEIRPATSDDDLGHLARIVCTITPDFPPSVTEMRWSDNAYPGGRRFLAVNAPMRAVNARLGYGPMPDEIYYRGPVAPFVAVPA